MARITYIEADGTKYAVDVASGVSLMEGARSHGVAGILADCGGNCACGTCRVFVAENWISRLGEASELEAATLEMRDEPQPGERLSCQITVTDSMEGLVLHLPARQF